MDPLVSAEWLAAELGAPDLVVCDATKYLPNETKDGRAEFLAGHIPGARYFDIDEVADPDTDLPHMVPSPGRFARLVGAMGIGSGSRVVFYDQKGLASAARGWWLMGLFGHDRAAVLDGGLAAWAAAGLPVTTEVPDPEPGSFTAGPGGGMPVLDDAGASNIARSGFLLDARVAERYRGEVEPIDPVAGHIPGAISAPAWGNLTRDGLFLSRAELGRRFSGIGLPRPSELAPEPGEAPMIAAYCGSGVTAAQEVLALELAGLRAALYVGSWSAWSADRSRPVATGPDPG